MSIEIVFAFILEAFVIGGIYGYCLGYLKGKAKTGGRKP